MGIDEAFPQRDHARQKVGALLLAVLAAACTKDPETIAASNARLQPILWDAGGGLIEQVAWFDRQLQLRCNFGLAEDDSTRCMPERVFLREDLFGDAQCASRAASSDDAFDFVVEQTHVTDPSECVPSVDRTTLHHAREVASSFERDPSGACIPHAGSEQHFYVAADRVDPAELAPMHDEDRSLGNGLAVREHVTEEGAREAFAVLDDATRIACNFYPQLYPSRYGAVCIPLRLAEATTSHNSVSTTDQCLDDVLIAILVLGRPVPPYVLFFDYDDLECNNPRLSVRVLGAHVDVWTRQNNGCTPLDVATPCIELDPHLLGDVVAPESLVQLDIGDVGSGRLHRRGVRDPSGTKILARSLFHTSEYWDTEIDGACVAMRGDDEIRCTRAAPPYFADEACTIGVLLAGTQVCRPLPSSAWFGESPTTLTHRALGEVKTGRLYQQLDRGCVLAFDTADYQEAGDVLETKPTAVITEVLPN